MIDFKKAARLTVATTMLAVAGMNANAAVVNSSDINGLRTFSDTSTGMVWMDLDNYFDSATGTGSMTGLQMISAAQAAGFTVATRSQVQSLLDTLPLTGGEWSSYAAVMGFGDPRDLIWGLTQDGQSYGWAWSYSTDSTWQYSGASGVDLVAAGNGAGSQDLGVWAFRNGGQVPEPSTVTLLAIALLAGSASRARRNR
ncbi:MAG: PEP-CTERM sorting domain-containing protein [Rhodocyclaceae bacterium]|jgi:hypothetical protein|nr:MAG: PEP-CTERM sorting domain-containing protein [Rhodocyclaceae bacterium]